MDWFARSKALIYEWLYIYDIFVGTSKPISNYGMFISTRGQCESCFTTSVTEFHWRKIVTMWFLEGPAWLGLSLRSRKSARSFGSLE